MQVKEILNKCKSENLNPYFMTRQRDYLKKLTLLNILHMKQSSKIYSSKFVYIQYFQ